MAGPETATEALVQNGAVFIPGPYLPVALRRRDDGGMKKLSKAFCENPGNSMLLGTRIETDVTFVLAPTTTECVIFGGQNSQ